MPSTDISKCLGYDFGASVCEIASKCWRYRAPAQSYQSYTQPAPDFTPTLGCGSFYPLAPGEERQ
jgi:hypothetical protein